MIMVDKKILREMSQDVLVIPFTEEMADKLDKFCRILKYIIESGNFLFIYLLLDIIHNIKLSVIHCKYYILIYR